MRQIEDDPRGARATLSALYPHTGDAMIVGVTGNPGAGKSTLTSRLVGAFRAQDKKVGVIAVDPSSPFSGGAILGDRIRMMDHAADPMVFIRSCSSRGALGGVSRSTEDIALVMAAIGCDIVLIETVGVGQAEVDIMQLAHTVCVVMTPGYGDDVQALKAGILEIADIFVVNKSDHPGSDGVVRQLRAIWKLKEHGSDEWQPPVLRTIATESKGIDELVEQILAHDAAAHTQGESSKRRKRLELTLMRLVRTDLERALLAGPLAQEPRKALVDSFLAREADPYTAAEELVANLLGDG